MLKMSLKPMLRNGWLLTSLGELGIMITDYHKSEENQYQKENERAVNNTRENPEFNTISRISFNPANLIITT